MTPKRPDVALEVVEPAGRGPSLAPPHSQLALVSDEPGADEVSLREYLDVLVAGRWIVALAVAVALAGGVAYALLATPVYRSDVLLQVEDKKAGAGLLGDLSAAFGEASPAETEIEILRSRSILGAVVRELGLDVEARPRRFPLVGAAVARRHDGDEVAGAFLGLDAYGWGGERIVVGRLDVPLALIGEPLKLVARDEGRFELLDAEGVRLLEGEVGKPAAGGGVELFVSELRARPGLEFAVVRHDRDERILELQKELAIAEKGKKTGILRIALDGENPARIAAVLDSLSNAYVRKNVERRSAEAEKTLEFLDTQLPALRQKLDVAEAELERYRARTGSVDVTMEAQAAVTRAVDIEKAVAELKVEHAALRQKFTEDHPALLALAGKLKRLDAERSALEARLRKLPESELEAARRLRDVKVATELYMAVLNKAQELKVVKEGTIGNVLVLDPAIVPSKPVSPRKLAVVAISLLLGLGAGVAIAFARRALEEGVEDPDAVERALGVGVHASVPHSEAHATAEERARRDRKPAPLLAASDPRDLAVESLRSLRTSLQFALVEARSSVVAIGGPAPGVGKSFVAANLAHLLGEAGRRVLVVDADLRRGRLHQQFGEERGRGLADVVAGAASLDDVLRETASPNVRLLTTGTLPPNPAELLGSERFQRLLSELAARHDVVLVDTPPILAVTDAALVARQAGVNLFVLRAGKHPMREISAALRQFGRNGVRVQGLVMNAVRLDRGLGRRNAYHYQYRYE
jgi:tyrosine-protein kinase Etk/Wzc